MDTIDINADVGEGYGPWTMGPDADVLGVVSSANIAEGYHAGDATTLRTTTRLAAAADATIGAHVAYPDRAGFGRRYIEVAPTELTDIVLHQIGAVATFACNTGASGFSVGLVWA